MAAVTRMAAAEMCSLRAEERCTWRLPRERVAQLGTCRRLIAGDLRRDRRQRQQRGPPSCSALSSSDGGRAGNVNGNQRQIGVDLMEQQQPGAGQEQQPEAAAAAAAAAALGGAAAPHPQVWTKFVAETLLPTKLGKFRLRGYRHTVGGGRVEAGQQGGAAGLGSLPLAPLPHSPAAC